MGVCCVDGCNNEPFPGCRYSFHKFPKDEERKNEWIKAIPPRKQITKTSVICSAHFKSSDIFPGSGRKVLKPDAVPCLFSHNTHPQELARIRNLQNNPELTKAINNNAFFKEIKTATGWKQFVSQDYYLGFTWNEHSEELMIKITDYTSIWWISMTVEQILAEIQDHNPHIDIMESELFNMSMDMLAQPDKLTTVTITPNEDTLDLKLTKFFFFNVNIFFEFSLGTREFFFQEVTQPLLKTINDLKASETELAKLLVKKDLEIMEYKEEGGKIALRHLRTPIFDIMLHRQAHNVYDTYFGQEPINDSLLHKEIDNTLQEPKQKLRQIIPEINLQIGEPEEMDQQKVDSPQEAQPNTSKVKKEIEENSLVSKTPVKQEPKEIESQELSSDQNITSIGIKIEPEPDPLEGSDVKQEISSQSISIISNRKRKKISNL